MPDLVILPDTAARPLSYLLRPVFAQIVKETEWKMPHMEFFRVDRTANTGLLLEICKEYRISVEDVLAGKAPGISAVTADSMFGSWLLRDTALWKERARQITDLLTRAHIRQPDIVIFDDYITDYRVTSNAIRYAFSSNSIPVYAWMSSAYTFHKSQDPLHAVGIIDREHPRGRGKFHYAKGRGIGMTKDHKQHALLATPDASALPQMRQLRAEMREIGEEIRRRLRIIQIIEESRQLLPRHSQPTLQTTEPNWEADMMM